MQKRITTELKALTDNPPEQVSVVSDPNNQYKWQIYIGGPKSTPYEGGTFKVICNIDEKYPFKAPDIVFDTKIYHPNVKKDTGEICHDIYKKDWAPTKKISDNGDSHPFSSMLSIIFLERHISFFGFCNIFKLICYIFKQ